MEEYFANRRDRNALEDAAAMARSAASAARQAQAAAAVASTGLLQGDSALGMPTFSDLDAFVSDVVDPFFGSVAAPETPLHSSLVAASVCLTTNSTVTAISGTPLRSVYLLQNPVPSLSV